MLTYTTLEGKVYDLSDLTPEERAYFDESWAAYEANQDRIEFQQQRVFSTQNPVLRATGGLLNDSNFYHPLLRALRDLGSRLFIQQGGAKPNPKQDPSIH